MTENPAPYIVISSIVEYLYTKELVYSKVKMLSSNERGYIQYDSKSTIIWKRRDPKVKKDRAKPGKEESKE